MIQKTLLFLSTCIVLIGCNIGTSGIWKNDNIEHEKKAQLKALNDKLFNAITNNDASNLKAMMSDAAIQSGGDINNFTDQVSAALKTDSYKILDEYYVQSSTTGINNTIPGIAGDDSYVINHLVSNKEMFVSLLLPNGQGNEALILAIYGKYNNEWKLNILKIGQYTLFNKTATDYYKLAKSCYDKKYLVDAYTNINLSERLLRPANDIFIFQKEGEINVFNDKIKNELNKSFALPLTLDKISSKPKVFRIYPEMGDEGFCPMVQYLTSLNLKDTISLKTENEKIKKEVRTLFKGIDQDKKYIFFQAFNELPDGQKMVEHYGFIDQLAK
jgi:hypothetical protein